MNAKRLLSGLALLSATLAACAPQYVPTSTGAAFGILAVHDRPVARYGTSRAPCAPARSGSATRNPVCTSVRTWCSIVPGLTPSSAASSLLVRDVWAHSRSVRSRNGELSARAIAWASASAVMPPRYVTD